MRSPAINKKKKIAVFANGWNSENLAQYMDGLIEGLKVLKSERYSTLGDCLRELREEGRIAADPAFSIFYSLTGVSPSIDGTATRE